ncbi:MAG: hypothetical protein ABIQ30_10125 [Devosia sp.]
MGKKLKATVPVAPYEPTPVEQTAIAENASRKANRSPLVPLKVVSVEDGKGTIQVDHRASVAEPLFCEQLATDDSVFASYVAEQLGMLSVVNGQLSGNVLNAHLSTVRAIAPRDEVETLLACQMAAVHVITMGAAASLIQGAKGPVADLKIAQLNKLSRTFTTQIEALKRYRSKGDQRVVVEHVHVHEGGQAVVGNVTNGKAA